MSRPRSRIEWTGDATLRAERAAAARGLLAAAEHVLQVSREVVPIEEGTLARSGVASVDEQQLVAAVSYDTPYAARVHEDLNARHDQGRTAKYLERPAAAEAAAVEQIIAAAVRRALRG
ncbi:minor capsid protein [Kitasatospora sp. MBT66]|uniref:minor capsid protein n=1 Tax=Kitasatospora sp. MBT66 TaxID=1444769 RepID=UPI0005B7DDF4|nr:minor capsid protein [Kitasatospora sp. MBT66]